MCTGTTVARRLGSSGCRGTTESGHRETGQTAERRVGWRVVAEALCIQGSRCSKLMWFCKELEICFCVSIMGVHWSPCPKMCSLLQETRGRWERSGGSHVELPPPDPPITTTEPLPSRYTRYTSSRSRHAAGPGVPLTQVQICSSNC